MTRTFVKSVASAGAALGLVLSATSLAFPAGKPPAPQDTRKPVRAVAFYKQSVLMAQGLSPAAALEKARRFTPYPFSSVHYIPRGFQLAIVQVFPYIPGTQEPQDTETFMNLSLSRARRGAHGKPGPAAYFELDHQFGRPYTYLGLFSTSTVKLGGRAVAVSEQKYRDFRSHRLIDLLNVYWYDSRTKVATEVTADLATSGLSRAEIVKIAASVR